MMREWQVGDPIGDGNDIGVPDVPYMDYLKKHDYGKTERRNKNVGKSELFLDEALRLKKEGKFYDALAFINAAIAYNPGVCENWNVRGIVLWKIYENDNYDVTFEAADSFTRALEIEPKNRVVSNNKANFLTLWAMREYGAENFGFAKDIADEAISTFKDKTCYGYAMALFIKARVLRFECEHDEALEYYNRFLEICPDDEGAKKEKYELLGQFAIPSRDGW
jgi:tetratricopeptide (TPR) repeat protein